MTFDDRLAAYLFPNADRGVFNESVAEPIHENGGNEDCSDDFGRFRESGGRGTPRVKSISRRLTPFRRW
jgi:hypothetical protein